MNKKQKRKKTGTENNDIINDIKASCLDAYNNSIFLIRPKETAWEGMNILSIIQYQYELVNNLLLSLALLIETKCVINQPIKYCFNQLMSQQNEKKKIKAQIELKLIRK